MLEKKEFDLLNYLIKENRGCSQRELAQKLHVSLGSINKIYNALINKQLISKGIVTEQGKIAMEPYKVKRAIFLAAGFGSRMVPITLNTPKPLVRVNGTRIIDTLLDAVIAAGINDIIIVRGYLGEQFDQLISKYPNIKFIDNPYYNEANNISSAICVRNLLENSYVLESDLLLSNKDIIQPYQYNSNFLGFPVAITDDWCMFTDKNLKILKQQVGGENCYQMIGISYWSKEDGIKLSHDLLEVFKSPGGKERYWEQTALVYKKNNYKVFARPCNINDVIEIDTFNELKQIDPVYNV